MSGDNQLSMFEEETPTECCYRCQHFAEFKEARSFEDRSSRVSKNTLVGWIYRGCHPDIELLIAVADVLEMSLDELVGRNTA